MAGVEDRSRGTELLELPSEDGSCCNAEKITTPRASSSPAFDLQIITAPHSLACARTMVGATTNKRTSSAPERIRRPFQLLMRRVQMGGISLFRLDGKGIPGSHPKQSPGTTLAEEAPCPDYRA